MLLVMRIRITKAGMKNAKGHEGDRSTAALSCPFFSFKRSSRDCESSLRQQKTQGTNRALFGTDCAP